jgi:hypothetical protein
VTVGCSTGPDHCIIGISYNYAIEHKWNSWNDLHPGSNTVAVVKNFKKVNVKFTAEIK